MFWDIAAWVTIVLVVVTFFWRWLFPGGLAAHRSILDVFRTPSKPHEVILKMRCLACGCIYYVKLDSPQQCPRCGVESYVE